MKLPLNLIMFKERPLVTSSRSSVVWIFIALPVIFGMVVVNVIYCWARSRSTARKQFSSILYFNHFVTKFRK